MTNPDNRSSPLAAAGWAIFLACSWTWCIGMFLPALLVRDYGSWGFVAFAIPNVIGAASLGWIIKSRQSAHKLIETHTLAISLFSIVTILFQAFFAGWLLSGLGLANAVPHAAILLLGCTIGIIAPQTRSLLIWSAVAYIMSLAVASQLNTHHALDWSTSPMPDKDIFLLTPVLIFGFAFCPYLDATFIHARSQLSTNAARAAFTIGFGVLFLAMILLTYAARALPVAWHQSATTALAAAYAIHVAVQLAFTISVHARHIPTKSSTPKRLLHTLICLILGITLGIAASKIQVTTNLELGFRELVYRIFLSFYGLIFPTYVWLIMIPTRDRHAGISGPEGAAKLRILFIALALAAPCYWLGFIMRIEIWLIPGVAIPLLARLFLPSQPQQTTSQAA